MCPHPHQENTTAQEQIPEPRGTPHPVTRPSRQQNLAKMPESQKISVLTATVPVVVREASNHDSFSSAIISSVMVVMSQRWCSPV